MKENRIESIPSPEGVDVVVRGDGTEKIRMSLNHNGHAVRIGERELEAYGCRIERL